MKSRLEKTCFILVALICFLGIGLSYFLPEAYVKLFTQVRGPLHVLTLIGLALAAFIFFYRSRVLRPFRSRGFLTSLLVQGSLLTLAWLEQLFWSVGLERSPLFQASLIATVLYFLIVPVLYSKSRAVMRFFDRFALASPRLIHTGLYLFLVILVLLVKEKSSLELIEFAGVWLFILVIYSPKNKRQFSRVSLTR